MNALEHTEAYTPTAQQGAEEPNASKLARECAVLHKLIARG